MDVATGELVDGPIDRCRYSGVAWLPGGKAFYYVRRLPPEAVPDGESQYHRRLYLHVVGTAPETDALVFGEGRDKTTYYGASVSRDGRWLMLSASIGTAPREDVWIADLTASDPAAPGAASRSSWGSTRRPRRGSGGTAGCTCSPTWTRRAAGSASPTRPRRGPKGWRDLIPEDPSAVLRGYAILDDDELTRPVLVVSRTRHAVSEVTVHDLATGERLADARACRGSARSAGSRSGPRAGTRRGSATRTTRRRRWCCATTRRPARVDTWAMSPGSVADPPAVTGRRRSRTTPLTAPTSGW